MCRGLPHTYAKSDPRSSEPQGVCLLSGHGQRLHRLRIVRMGLSRWLHQRIQSQGGIVCSATLLLPGRICSEPHFTLMAKRRSFGNAIPYLYILVKTTIPTI